jgi:hypothetical protein
MHRKNEVYRDIWRTRCFCLVNPCAAAFKNNRTAQLGGSKRYRFGMVLGGFRGLSESKISERSLKLPITVAIVKPLHDNNSTIILVVM